MAKWDESGRPEQHHAPGVARAIRGWRAAVDEGVAAVGANCGAYDRRRILPRLIAFDTRDLSNAGPALDAAIQSRLKRALRAERRRGVAGHWTYDLNRHLALMQALAAEEDRQDVRGGA